jgi:coenzyme F420-reducing hydrogenase beta subunit
LAEAVPAPIAPRDIVRAGLCIGCGACVAGRRDARMAWDRFGQWKPQGADDWYAAPDAGFTRTCPFSPAAADETRIADARFPAAPERSAGLGRFEAAYVGHVAQDGFRANGSSGGMVSWVAAELLASGAVDAVAHVAPLPEPQRDGRFFAYRLSRDAAAVAGGAKSRYFPVELSAVIAEIRATPGRYAVVGVPCFIKAIHLARAADPVLAERIVHTLGLFCGHMKSARLVDSFAWQLGAPLRDVRAVDYRIKDAGRPANWYRAHLTLADGGAVAQDWWHLADGDWGAGFFQHDACNMCDDVMAETADIAFGDAWVEPYASDGRGTNVVVVRSPAMRALVDGAIAAGRLALAPVDAAFVEDTQAAGLRHRREGLAYRLTWASTRRRAVRPVKRVAPGAALPLRRRLVYRTRAAIAWQSHRVALVARRLGRGAVYVAWARAALHLYQALTWSRGRLGTMVDRILPDRGKSA